MDIKLNFINNSNGANNSSVVVFQKNVATDFEELAVAWKVINSCGQGNNHPFTFPMLTEVNVSDDFGNYTPQLQANPGQMFQMEMDDSGNVLSLAGSSESSTEIEIVNNLSEGAINANIYKNGELLAVTESVEPNENAVFEFKPTIWIGVVSQVEQGEVMNSAIISQVNTELSLLGIASADIVMTGGGPGPNAQPFQFSLQNIQMV